jgi:glycosyltransferase involved in cell wall biosynthesis
MGLSARGATLDVVVPGHPYASDTSSLNGVTIHRATYADPPFRQQLAVGLGGIVPNLRRRPWLAAYVPALVHALRREAVRRAGCADLVHAHWLFPGGIAGLAAATQRNIPLVVTCHGGDVNLARRIRPFAWWSAPVLKRADRLTAVSYAMQRSLLVLGADPHRVQMLPLGVAVPPDCPAADMPPAWHAFGASPSLRVLFAGGLSQRKSPETLIEAVRLLQSRGQSVAAAFIGDGPRRASLERAAAHLKNVWIAGDRPPDEVATWIRASDVLVLPSRSEGRGLVLVEAMACGRAVVSSNIPGPDELVHDGRTGFRFPAGNPTALADCLVRFIQAPRLVAEFGRRGRAFVESEGLLLEDSLDRHLAMYQEVVARTWDSNQSRRA